MISTHHFKLIFVDFDDTLYIHKKHWLEDGSKNELMASTMEYDSRYLNKGLIEKLWDYKKSFEDTKIIMFAAGKTSGYFDNKHNFLMKEVPGLFNGSISVTSTSSKVEFINLINTHTKVSIPEVLIIDDNTDAGASFNSHGYECFTPLYFEKFFFN